MTKEDPCVEDNIIYSQLVNIQHEYYDRGIGVFMIKAYNSYQNV